MMRRRPGTFIRTDLMTATTLFELDRRSPGDGKPGIIYARDRRRRPDKKPSPTSTRAESGPAGGGVLHSR
jgi:hypothetical protein